MPEFSLCWTSRLEMKWLPLVILTNGKSCKICLATTLASFVDTRITLGRMVLVVGGETGILLVSVIHCNNAMETAIRMTLKFC